MNSDFFFEYQYEPCPDAEERLAQAWDIIFSLILEDYQAEQKEESQQGETEC
jgi:hypothetical protein